MAADPTESKRERVPAEQRRYAFWLELGVRAGFAALAASFVVYLTGIMPRAIAPADLPRYWGLPVAEYLAATGAPTGWAWVARLGESDWLNFVGVAILAMVTAVCCARVVPLFWRAGDRALAALCVVQIVVLALAAAGVFGITH